MEWAARERDERRRYLAASAIQRATRNYLAPIFMARQKIQEDSIVFNRRRRLNVVLKVWLACAAPNALGLPRLTLCLPRHSCVLARRFCGGTTRPSATGWCALVL